MRLSCEDNIETDIEDTLCENVHCIYLAYNMVHCGAVVSTVMKLVQLKISNIFDSL
jgi:hypothetical protein